VKKYLRKILLVFPLLFIFSAIYIIPRLIIVRKIICNSQYSTCDQLIMNEINKSLDKKLPLAKKELKVYLENNFLIRDFSIQYKIPDSLKVI